MKFDIAYEELGVGLIKGWFSKKEIQRLRQLAFQAYRFSKEKDLQYKGSSPALMFYPPGLEEYTRRLQSIVQALLGDNVLQLNNQFYFRLPGDGDQFAWHQDICFRTPKEKFNQIETGYLQTAIIVDDMDLDNGPIEFVHGSHKWGEIDLVPRNNTETGLREYSDKYKGTPLIARAGDVAIWSVMIVHGSQPNESNRSRMYYMNGFAKEECVDPSLKFGHYLKNGVLHV